MTTTTSWAPRCFAMLRVAEYEDVIVSNFKHCSVGTDGEVVQKAPSAVLIGKVRLARSLCVASCKSQELAPTFPVAVNAAADTAAADMIRTLAEQTAAVGASQGAQKAAKVTSEPVRLVSD